MDTLFAEHEAGIEPHLRRYVGPTTEGGVDLETGIGVGIAKPVEAEQNEPLPVPETRPSLWWQFIFERNWGGYDPVLTGHKEVVEQTGAHYDPKQEMGATNKFRLNTFRVMPEPWDEGLFA